MQAELFLELPATTEHLDLGLRTIELYCVERNVPHETVLRIRLIVEELYSNTVKYGYRGQPGGKVRLRISPKSPVVLVYEDDAPLFDPTLWNIDAELDLPPDERAVGGTGIALVRSLASRLTYTALANGNRLAIEFAAQPGEALELTGGPSA